MTDNGDNKDETDVKDAATDTSNPTQQSIRSENYYDPIIIGNYLLLQQLVPIVILIIITVTKQ